jgi:hypothetical protein
MACALVDQQAHGSTRAEYIVCVNFFILTFSSGLEVTEKNARLSRRLESFRQRYRRNAFTALEKISILNPPSLSLLQALLAGVG